MESKKITYQKIKGTKYILLDNGMIARLLKPEIKQYRSGVKHYYHLTINNETRLISVEEIQSTLIEK